MATSKNNKPKPMVAVSLQAIDPYLERNIVSPFEKRSPGRDYIEWGDGNAYPDYLLDLYNNVPTLRSIINGNVDFISGNDVTCVPFHGYPAGIMNTRGDNIREQVRDAALDFEIYGGFALQVIRDHTGAVAEIYYIDVRFLRSNKENTVFYYSENWDKARRDMAVYPEFMPDLDWAGLTDEERDRHASSIVYVKNTHTQVYPAPLYAAAVKACEIERGIDDYHLNSLANGFNSSMIVSFNAGIPDDEMKREIEAQFNDKFAGSPNAGRILFSWNRSKENATTFEYPKIEDFGDKYKALAEHSRQQIFTAFRANSNLFGIAQSTGFSQEEYEQSFKLYNRTQVRPVQRLLGDTYDRILGMPNCITIAPFSLESQGEQTVS